MQSLLLLLGFFLQFLALPSLARSAYQQLNISGGVSFAYIDSGPVPKSSDYTTYVFIHGDGFNSGMAAISILDNC